jgi:hypothetical protein
MLLVPETATAALILRAIRLKPGRGVFVIRLYLSNNFQYFLSVRFLTFIKQSPEPSDLELAAFKKWYLASKMGKNNPHAGIPQITLFVHVLQPPQAVISGFYKWLDAYQKQNR